MTLRLRHALQHFAVLHACLAYGLDPSTYYQDTDCVVGNGTVGTTSPLCKYVTISVPSTIKHVPVPAFGPGLVSWFIAGAKAVEDFKAGRNLFAQTRYFPADCATARLYPLMSLVFTGNAYDRQEGLNGGAEMGRFTAARRLSQVVRDGQTVALLAWQDATVTSFLGPMALLPSTTLAGIQIESSDAELETPLYQKVFSTRLSMRYQISSLVSLVQTLGYSSVSIMTSPADNVVAKELAARLDAAAGITGRVHLVDLRAPLDPQIDAVLHTEPYLVIVAVTGGLPTQDDLYSAIKRHPEEPYKSFIWPDVFHSDIAKRYADNGAASSAAAVASGRVDEQGWEPGNENHVRVSPRVSNWSLVDTLFEEMAVENRTVSFRRLDSLLGGGLSFVNAQIPKTVDILYAYSDTMNILAEFCAPNASAAAAASGGAPLMDAFGNAILRDPAGRHGQRLSSETSSDEQTELMLAKVIDPDEIVCEQRRGSWKKGGGRSGLHRPEAPCVLHVRNRDLPAHPFEPVPAGGLTPVAKTVVAVWQPLRWIMFSFAVVLLLSSFVAGAWTWKNRKTMVVRFSQPFFLVIIIVGCCLSALSVMVMVFEHTMSGGCETGILLHIGGFSLSIGALFSKVGLCVV